MTDNEAGQFVKYLEILIKWQRVHRLLGSIDPVWIVNKIFLDSLLFLRALPLETGRILDVGSGAGVPGIPLKIVRPDIHVTLLEARQKRASFLAAAARDLEFTGVTVLSARLESVASQLQDQFDAVVARCAGDVGFVFGLGVHLIRSGGAVVVSGPPREHALPIGEWIVVPGVEPGEARRFAVYHRQ